MVWKPTFDVIVIAIACTQVLFSTLVFSRLIKISVFRIRLGAQFVEKVRTQHL